MQRYPLRNASPSSSPTRSPSRQQSEIFSPVAETNSNWEKSLRSNNPDSSGGPGRALSHNDLAHVCPSPSGDRVKLAFPFPVGIDALCTAATHGDMQQLQESLESLRRQGINPNSRDAQGRTALMYAAEAGQLQCLERLLFWDADPKLEGPHKETPGSLAASGGHGHCLAMLALAASGKIQPPPAPVSAAHSLNSQGATQDVKSHSHHLTQSLQASTAKSDPRMRTELSSHHERLSSDLRVGNIEGNGSLSGSPLVVGLQG